MGEFQIFERLRKDVQSHQSDYPDKIIITIWKTGGVFYGPSCKLLGLSLGDEVSFAKNNEMLYIAALPIDSKIKGFKCSLSTKEHKLIFNSINIVKRGVNPGIYEIINDPLIKSDVYWYPIEFIKSY